MRDYVDGLFFRVAGKVLSAAARRVLNRHQPLIIAVTGSVGKTSTKEAIAVVLTHGLAEKPDYVRKSIGNSNDAVGMPAAILGLRGSLTITGKLRLLVRGLLEAVRQVRSQAFPRILVLEYGAGSKYTSIVEMARLARPSIAVVTAVGPAHLDRFKTVEALADHKSAIVRAVPADGLVVLGSDTPLSAAMSEISPARVVLVPGRGRALAEGIARVIGHHLGLNNSVIDTALSQLPATEGRLCVVETAKCTLIDDAYNASPLSMTLGLDTLASTGGSGRRRVAILGSMAELGAQAVMYHEQVGAYARSRADVVIAVGQLALHYGAPHWFPDASACALDLPELIGRGDVVLVKGSHSVGLGAVVRSLKEGVSP